MTPISLLALRLTCPECGVEYDDTTAEIDVRFGFGVFRCLHCHEGQIALAVLKRRSPLPDPMPSEHHETMPGVLGWIDAVDWHGWPWQWHWKERKSP